MGGKGWGVGEWGVGKGGRDEEWGDKGRNQGGGFYVWDGRCGIDGIGWRNHG